MQGKILDKNGKEIHLDVELHPGEVLADELEARNLTKSALALKLGVYPSHLGEIVKGKRNVTANIALKLEKELGIAAEFWMSLQMDYDLYIERKKLQTA